MSQKLALIFLLLTAVVSQAALPPFAKDYLNKIPDKKLTLPFVVQTALMNADSYKIIGLEYQRADLELLTIEAANDTIFSGSANYADDNSVKTSDFQPARAKKWDWGLGFSKNWATGTKTSLQWVHEWNTLQLSNTAQALFGNAFVTDYKQTVGIVSLEQSLLKDSFGYSYRKQVEAAKKRGEALKWKSQSELENTTLSFISEFYKAWLLQQQVTSLREQVERQKKLVRVMQSKNKKGAVEKPELIQIEALLASTIAKYDLAQAELITQWEQLVIGLKLPMEFINVDPMDIPTAIDDPVPFSVRICGLKEPKKTADIMSLEKNLEAAKADFSSAKNASLPDLKLVAGYKGNSVDNSGSQTMEDVFDGQYQGPNPGLGPAWNVGLTLAWPLDNSIAQAKRSEKYIQKEQLTSRLQIENDSLHSQWRELCRKLKVESNNEKTYTNVVKQQKIRVNAENRRFSLGRVSVNELVTAEDDLGQWEFLSQQKAIEVRQLAWTVQKVSGELYNKIAPALEARMNKGE